MYIYPIIRTENGILRGSSESLYIYIYTAHERRGQGDKGVHQSGGRRIREKELQTARRFFLFILVYQRSQVYTLYTFVVLKFILHSQVSI